MESTLTCTRDNGGWRVGIIRDHVEEFKAYLNEIRYPYTARSSPDHCCDFIFPTNRQNLEETLLFYFDGIYEMIAFVDESKHGED